MTFANSSQPHKRKAASTTRHSGSPAQTQPDIYQRITDQIIAAIEAGAGDWQMPWHTKGGQNIIRPINATSGKPYRGVNILALWIAADGHGYQSYEWATYKQWQEKGAQVRRGEKSTQIVFWKITDQANGETDNADNSEGDHSGDDQAEDRSRPILARTYTVFNADQVDNYTPKEALEPIAAPVPEFTRIVQAERFFSALGADIRHGGNRAFYRPSGDYIQMPPFTAFRDPIAYYATLGHECTHWTGVKHRLDRDMTGRFGNEAYAAEELIAELSAAFLSADLELTNEPRPDHAAYVANWLKVLKNDNRAIFTAATKAQQAVDYLHGLQGQAPVLVTAIQPVLNGAPVQFQLAL